MQFAMHSLPWMKRFSVAMFCWIGLSTNPLHSQEAADRVVSGEVQLTHSHVYVHVGKVGLGHEHAAVCQLKSGALSLVSPNAMGAYGKLVFDMASFDADGDTARRYIGLTGSTDASTRKQVNENMLGKEVLDVKKYPVAIFEAKRISKMDGPSKRGFAQYKFEGDFTLHGTKKPLEFIADVEIVKGWQHVRGAFTILQSDYGIKPYSKMLGAVGVADKLEIFGDLYVAP